MMLVHNLFFHFLSSIFLLSDSAKEFTILIFVDSYLCVKETRQ